MMTTKINSFEDIEVWKKSRVFTKNIYKVTNNGLFQKDVDLTRQIRRAAISITSNIAEGFERQTDKEFRQFLFIAKASAGEVRSQLYVAHDLDYIDKITFEELLEQIKEISRMLSGFIKYLND